MLLFIEESNRKLILSDQPFFREGGTGFDYRLAMAVPDMWIKYLKEVRDEDCTVLYCTVLQVRDEGWEWGTSSTPSPTGGGERSVSATRRATIR